MNLYQKIIEVRKCLPYLQKDVRGYRYKYVKGADILKIVQAKCNELGILIYPEVGHGLSEKKTDGEVISRCVHGAMSYKIVNAENPEEQLNIPWSFYGENNDISKAFGSALTYSERYFMLKFFLIPTDEDDPDRWQNGQDSFKKLDPLKEMKSTLAELCKDHHIDAKRYKTDVETRFNMPFDEAVKQNITTLIQEFER